MTFQTKEGKTFTKQPDLVFGTDGAFSRIRGAMQKAGRFNYSQTYLDHGYKELTIPAGPNGEWQIDKHALHIWPREAFMLIALPNEDGSFTCTLFLSFEGPVSFEQLQDEKSLRAFFEAEFADCIPLMPNLVETFFENPTSSLITIKCAPWNYNNRFLLLGDASHAIVPFYGQGMNSGFEDCTLFNEKLSSFEKSGNVDWGKLFHEFSEERKEDADAISDLALQNFIEMRDLVADQTFLLRKKIEKSLQKKYPDIFTPTYSMVTFSHSPYREALAETRAQNQLFDKILRLERVEEHWNNGLLDSEIHRLVQSYHNEKH